jgi:hypothetical protein
MKIANASAKKSASGERRSNIELKREREGERRKDTLAAISIVTQS